MNIQKFNSEIEELVELLCSNVWPYHANARLERQSIRNAAEKGYYCDGRETFWIISEQQKVGILVIDDIDDSIPLFDIRLIENVRGKGIGVKVLQWLQGYLFGELEKIRIEAYTRADNIAMQKCFIKGNFVKEGYLRNAWENEDGTILDSMLFAAIYDDWKNNTITLPKLDDTFFNNTLKIGEIK